MEWLVCCKNFFDFVDGTAQFGDSCGMVYSVGKDDRFGMVDLLSTGFWGYSKSYFEDRNFFGFDYENYFYDSDFSYIWNNVDCKILI